MAGCPMVQHLGPKFTLLKALLAAARLLGSWAAGRKVRQAPSCVHVFFALGQPNTILAPRKWRALAFRTLALPAMARLALDVRSFSRRTLYPCLG